jgi:predicted nucleotidyltransferase
LNSVKVFWLEQEELLEEIYKVAREIGKANEKISKIILFGSLAERRGVPGSDADILIILERDDKPFMDRIAEWSERFSMNFPVEIFPYTKKELNNPIVQESVKRGIILFER